MDRLLVLLARRRLLQSRRPGSGASRAHGFGEAEGGAVAPPARLGASQQVSAHERAKQFAGARSWDSGYSVVLLKRSCVAAVCSSHRPPPAGVGTTNKLAAEAPRRPGGLVGASCGARRRTRRRQPAWRVAAVDGSDRPMQHVQGQSRAELSIARGE